MKLKNQYLVQFGGLGLGEHQFDFDIRDTFFETYPAMEANGGNLQASVVLTKSNTMLTLKSAIKGYVILACDRCCDDYEQPITFSGTFYVKFSSKADEAENSDEIMHLFPGETEIDMMHYFYESICLNIPLKRVHPQEEGKRGCNPEVLKYIKNIEGESPDSADLIDISNN